MTLTQNKTLNKACGSFLYDVCDRYIDYKGMLHYDGELNIGVKLDDVAYFTLFYHVNDS